LLTAKQPFKELYIVQFSKRKSVNCIDRLCPLDKIRLLEGFHTVPKLQAYLESIFADIVGFISFNWYIDLLFAPPLKGISDVLSFLNESVMITIIKYKATYL
jgi:hypothetical protein